MAEAWRDIGTGAPTGWEGGGRANGRAQPDPLPLSSSSDGLERVQVDEDATVGALKAAIEAALGVPAGEVTLSPDAALLTSKGLEDGVDLLAPDRAVLADLGVKHGDLVSGREDGWRRGRDNGRAGRQRVWRPSPLVSSTCSSPLRATSPPPSSATTANSAPR
jgi:hypothetical protein